MECLSERLNLRGPTAAACWPSFPSPTCICYQLRDGTGKPVKGWTEQVQGPILKQFLGTLLNCWLQNICFLNKGFKIWIEKTPPVQHEECFSNPPEKNRGQTLIFIEMVRFLPFLNVSYYGCLTNRTPSQHKASPSSTPGDRNVRDRRLTPEAW